MKLKPVTVALRRGENGFLNAYVVMAGMHGINLLAGRKITLPEDARTVAAQLLATNNIEVGEWIDESGDPPVADRAQSISTGRDSYGWRSLPSGSRFLGDPKDHRK